LELTPSLEAYLNRLSLELGRHLLIDDQFLDFSDKFYNQNTLRPLGGAPGYGL
jgi:hypothetical protein